VHGRVACYQAVVAKRIQSLDRAVSLLTAISALPPGEATLATVADRCALNRSTAWRLLATLQHHELVERDEATNSYGVGVGAIQLAGLAGVDGLVRRAHPAIAELASVTGETASLAAPRELALVYVDQVTAVDDAGASWLGRQVALHATSTGKAYLAWLSPREVAAVLPRHPERFTNTTMVDERALRQELARTRERGFGVCRGEQEPTSWGVSAPVIGNGGRPFAVVSVWGPSRRVGRARLAALGAQVMEAAERLAQRFQPA
jgi:DNA-binding IclR family transcriptional regulator